MAKLLVRLLGGFRVELDGETVYAFESDKGRALLAYLIVEADRPHRREALAALLWPEKPDAVARANLRQALSALRRALGEPNARGSEPTGPEKASFLFVTHTDAQFNTVSEYCLDVAELEAYCRPPYGHGPRAPSLGEPLLPAAYCADFLAGFAVPDSEAFQAWVLNKQEHCHRLALEILDAQSSGFERARDYEHAVAAARLQLELEPWLEGAHRRCMRGLALAGRRDEALRQYEWCRSALATELGVEPAASTRALYDAIRTGNVAPARRPRHIAPLSAAPFSAASVSAATHGALASRLVAREDELGQLASHLESALAGEPGIAFVSGDAGSGKTALLESFAITAMAEHAELLLAGARCAPGGSRDPLAPLRRLAEALFGDLETGPGAWLHDPEQAERMRCATGVTLAALRKHGPDLIGTLIPAPAVRARVRQARGGGGSEKEPTAERKRSGGVSPLAQGALFDQLMATLAAISRTQPLLLLFDDLHWVDEATAAFLLRIGRELSGCRVLVLGAHRSATVALGRDDPRSGEVRRHPLAGVLNELRRTRGEIVVDLDRANGRAFVEDYLDTQPNRLGASFRDALYAHTGGHALFTVESLRNLQSRGQLVKDEAGRWISVERLDWGTLPARVDAAIAERVERLPERSRRLLACASVQGDEFSAEMVADEAEAPPAEVRAALSGALARQHHLVRPEGVEREANASRSVYRFTHHLFQKYFYDQLDPIEKARLHGAIAASLERQVGDDPEARERVAARLAWHYESGGLALPAARALHDAGRQAMLVSAFREALSRYDHGLELLAGEPESAERGEIGRLLEIARLGPARGLGGLASGEVQTTLARAVAAWEGHAAGRPGLLLLWQQCEILMGTGRLEEAFAAAEQLQESAAQAGEDDFVALAHLTLSLTLHFAGRPEESERRLRRAFAELTPEGRAVMRAATGMDAQATGLSYSAWNQWLLGCGEAALATSREAIAVARNEGASLGLACALALGAALRVLLRMEDEEMAAWSEECGQLCAKHELTMWGVFFRVLRGRQMVVAGEEMTGIEQMLQAGWQGRPLVLVTDFFAALVADSCLLAADRRATDDLKRVELLETGLAAIDRMLDLNSAARRTRTFEAELVRLQGELLLARDGPGSAGEVRTRFEQAAKIAREQGAPALELRAGMSRVRMYERHDGGDAAALIEARRALGDVTTRFTEGFTFPDFQDAAAMAVSPDYA